MGSDERIGPLAWQMYAQIVVGIFLLAFAYFIGRDHVRLVLLGVHTRGKLVGYQEQRLAGSSGSTFWDSAYMPVVEFQIAAQTVRFRDWMGSNFRVPMGGSVPIVYDPHHPANAMIDRPVWNWVPWAPMMAVGLLLIIAGVRCRCRFAPTNAEGDD
ncbi:MAG TPA: DUF3592 domain-containing protein [Candidatus Sulfotelmatobacter sp.]|nr:DUF3592 domain-containing protein [Candidatus Sulfotelmatobacter sp.]